MFLGSAIELPCVVVLQVNGRLVLDGPLRVNWGVQSAIQFKKKDDDNEGQTPETPQHWRKSYKLAINNGLNDADPEVCDQFLSSFPLLVMKLFPIKQIR